VFKRFIFPIFYHTYFMKRTPSRILIYFSAKEHVKVQPFQVIHTYELSQNKKWKLDARMLHLVAFI